MMLDKFEDEMEQVFEKRLFLRMITIGGMRDQVEWGRSSFFIILSDYASQIKKN